MLDQLRGLAIFANVADAGSFSAAAKRLGVTPSVVSYHVTALERYLDTPLIYRTTRKLSLTQQGEKLAQSAHEMIRLAESGFDEIGLQSPTLTGRLRITAPAILQYSRFVTRISTFVRRHRKIEASLSFSDQRFDLIQDRFDLGIRIGTLTDSSMISRKLADGSLRIVASPDYLNQFDDLTDPNDLQQMELIDLKGVEPRMVLTHSRDSRSRRMQVSHRVSVDSGFAARRMVEEGCGIAVLPDFFVQEGLDDGKLVSCLPDWHPPAYGIFAIWPPNAGTNHLRNSFLKYVAAIAKSEPESDRTID